MPAFSGSLTSLRSLLSFSLLLELLPPFHGREGIEGIDGRGRDGIDGRDIDGRDLEDRDIDGREIEGLDIEGRRIEGRRGMDGIEGILLVMGLAILWTLFLTDFTGLEMDLMAFDLIFS